MDKPIDFSFSQQEIKILRSTWASLKIIDVPPSFQEPFLYDLQFNVSYVHKFNSKLNNFINASQNSHGDLVNQGYQIDSLIQIISLSIVNLPKLSFNRENYINIITKFAKRNSNLDTINIEQFCECLVSTVDSLLPAFNSIHHIVLLRFLNKLFNLIGSYGQDDSIQAKRHSQETISMASNLSLSVDAASSATDLGVIPAPILETNEKDLDIKPSPQPSTETTIADHTGYSSEEDDAFDYLNSFAPVSQDTRASKNRRLSKAKSSSEIGTQNRKLRRFSSNLGSIRSNDKQTKKDSCVIM